MCARKKVILANKPQLFRELLARVLQKSIPRDYLIEIEHLSMLERMVAQVDPACVIVSLDGNGGIPAPVARALEAHAVPCVVGVSRRGDRVKLGHAAPEPLHLDALLAFLRDALPSSSTPAAEAA